MKIVTLGIAVILAKLFPYGSLLLSLPLNGILNATKFVANGHVIQGVLVAANYILAMVAAIIFVRKAQLKSRLPEVIPGQSSIRTGLVLIATYVAVALFSMTIEGGGGSYVLSSLGFLIIFPAHLLILGGVVTVLLAALPRIPLPPT